MLPKLKVFKGKRNKKQPVLPQDQITEKLYTNSTLVWRLERYFGFAIFLLAFRENIIFLASVDCAINHHSIDNIPIRTNPIFSVLFLAESIQKPQLIVFSKTGFCMVFLCIESSTAWLYGCLVFYQNSLFGITHLTKCPFTVNLHSKMQSLLLDALLITRFR